MFTQEQRGELALYIQENYSDPILIDAGAGIIDVEKPGAGPLKSIPTGRDLHWTSLWKKSARHSTRCSFCVSI